jgi:5-methylcytosine-specific restriction endonuclease McrA
MLSGGDAARQYDRHGRDPEAKRFYRSAAWLGIRSIKLRRDPLCERCLARGLLIPATTVHHKRERREAPDLALDLDNLESLCPSCHSSHHDASRATHARP